MSEEVKEPSTCSDEPQSWREAWEANPGPRSLKECLVLMAKGFAMGTANVIPGVSGGTIALITGIYTPLLDGIASIKGDTISLVARGKFKASLASFHACFLALLTMGIVASTVSTAGLMSFLLKDYKVETWSLFFGLIAASIVLVKREASPWKPSTYVMMLLGIVGAWLFVGLVPVKTTDAPWFVFLCGMIAMCAMILPGLSGSFLLLMLGKYEYVIGALKNPLSVDSLLILGTFIAGCVVGVAAFSRLLKWCLHHYHSQTMGLLMGFMIGAMRKVWPWKDVLDQEIIHGKVKVLEEANRLPAEFNAEVMVAIGLAVFGVILVLALDRIAGNEKAEPVENAANEGTANAE
jgi:putative membrane protein